MANEIVEETQGQANPANLEEAIKLLREKDSQTADENVAAAGADESGDQSGEGLGDGAPQGRGDTQGSVEGELEASATSIPDGEAGGHADTSGEYTEESQVSHPDYAVMQQNMIESIRRQAAQAANDKFREEGIQRVTLTQLYQRDENTGRVTFHNPDDPNRPFESRAEAQAWVDSYNAQVQAEWTNYANQMQQEYAKQTLPAMRLMQFAPTYDAMDDRTKKFFDVIINPYSVRDSTGEVIGFSCDLNAAANQAKQLAAIEGSGNTASNPQQVEKAVENVATGPALDATTSGSDTSKPSDKAPKNLNEAWKLINKNKKEKK